MNDKVYSRLRKHFNEVYSIEPNDLAIPFFTKIYKRVTPYVKSFPFRIFIPASLVVAAILYLLLGGYFIRLVTILQYGF